MPDRHDTIEEVLIGIVPAEGLDDSDGVTHTACTLAGKIERALVDAGYVHDNVQLDPAPYRRMMGEERYRDRPSAPQGMPVVFDPRRPFDQHETSYR